MRSKRQSLNTSYRSYTGTNKELLRNSRIIFKLKNGLKDYDRSTTKIESKSKLPDRLNTDVKEYRSNSQNNQQLNRSFRELNTTFVHKSPEHSVAKFKNKQRNKTLPDINPSKEYDQPEVNPEVELLRNLSLNTLEQKIQALLSEKLELVAKQKNNKQAFTDEDRFKHFELNQMLQNLIDAIKSKKDTKGEHNTIEEKWDFIDNKIQFLQRILAENATQLDISKRSMSNFNLKRTSYKSTFNKANRPYNAEKLINTNKIRQSLSRLTSEPINKFPIASTNNTYYHTPDEKDYEKYRFQHPKYNIQHRPVPQSSYQSSFPYYNGPWKILHKGRQDNIVSHRKAYKVNSSYQKEFTEKESKLDNYRDLDCYKDKFTNLKIRYFEKPEPPSEEVYKTMAKLQHEYNDLKREHPVVAMTSSKQLMPLNTTTKANYGQPEASSKKFIKCTPKNSRLEEFKSKYKKFINAKY